MLNEKSIDFIFSIKNPQTKTFTNGKFNLMSLLPSDSHITALSIQYDDKEAPITNSSNYITFNIGNQQNIVINPITKEFNLQNIDITTFELTKKFSPLINCTIVCGYK